MVVDGQLTLVDGAAKLADEAEPVRAVLVASGAVELDAALVRLRRVHGDVRPLHQGRRVRPVSGRDRDADARRHVHLHVGDRERLLQDGGDPEGNLDGGRVTGDVGEQDPELVPAEPGDHVALA